MAETEAINLKQIVCREFDINELWKKYICHPSHRNIIWSWAIRKPEIMIEDKCLRFRVSGRYHKGHVYIVLNGMDLFDVYYTSIHGIIKNESKDVYLEDLIHILDNVIETK